MRTKLCCVVVVVSFLLAGCVPPSGQSGGQQGGDDPETAGGVSSGSGPHIESGGRVVVEAEHFTRTAGDYAEFLGIRIPLDNVAWFVQQGGVQTGTPPDPDGFRSGASGDAYVEVLPDRRVTHDDPMPEGSIYDGLGGATLEYDIQFATPGTYYVWVRAYSSGTEDNGVHVSVNGELNDAGRKLQWCHRDSWAWSNNQRDSGGSACGVPGTVTITIPAPGLHTIVIHQREDGVDLDRFLLTTDPGYTPGGAGPMESPRVNP